MKLVLKITTLLLLICTGYSVLAQEIDLENVDDISKEDLLKLNGSASLSGIYYTGNSGNTERLPFTYFANGYVNARIANLIDVPLSFVLTNVGGSFQYPTLPSRLAIHPRYKWATAHIGNVAMVFSPYTLNGHLFDGIGVELQPGNWRVNAMAGRLQRPQEYDINNIASPAAFRRYGQGVKVGYEAERFRLAYTLFRAKDEVSSIYMLPPDSLNIRPQYNLVSSLEGSVKILKNLELHAEYANTALSTITGDESNNKTGYEKSGFNPTSIYLNTKTSTEYHSAFRSNLNYSFRKSVIGVGYERVDPGYRTLGAYFFNSDMENYTLNYSQSLLKDKMNIALSGGRQQDNLDTDKSATNTRTVGMVNLSYFPNQKINFIASYSNFTTYAFVQNRFLNINQLNPYEYIDTLDFSQISQNALLNANFMLKNTSAVIHSVNVMGNFLEVKDKNGDVVNNQTSSNFYNGGLTWSSHFVPSKITLSVGYNYSNNIVGANNFVTQGPIGSFAWQLLKEKLFTNLSLSYNTTSGAGMQATNIYNLRFNTRYLLAKKHSLNFSVLGQERTSKPTNSSDWIWTLSYEVAF